MLRFPGKTSASEQPRPTVFREFIPPYRPLFPIVATRAKWSLAPIKMMGNFPACAGTDTSKKPP